MSVRQMADRGGRAEFSHGDFSDLVGSIYDCAIDPSRWETTLAEVIEALDCHTAAMGLIDVPQNRFLMDKYVGIEPIWQERMQKHIPEINARITEALPTWPSFDEPIVISRHLSRAYFEASPYIQEVLMPQGIVDVFQYFLFHTPARYGALGIGRHERQGPVTDREIELGGLLLPHIRRAVTIGDLLDVRAIEHARMAEVLDTLRCGVLLTDSRGKILHANRAADEMLRAAVHVRDGGGILEAKGQSAAREMRAAIALATEDETQIGRTGLAVRLGDAGAAAMFAHVLPLAGGELRTRLVPTAVAAVFIGAPPDHWDGATLLAAAYMLTPAETRVLASLLAGRTLDETAGELKIAATTARSHLDHIFAKTGISRQAELIRLGTEIAPPGRASNEQGAGN
jgi:DNA-binding CsgD family transcriptional regulator/PAS domain-containing protein